MQKRASDPREVAALARRQERGLRSRLNGAPARDGGVRRPAAALESVAEEIEQAHGVPVDDHRAVSRGRALGARRWEASPEG